MKMTIKTTPPSSLPDNVEGLFRIPAPDGFAFLIQERRHLRHDSDDAFAATAVFELHKLSLLIVRPISCDCRVALSPKAKKIRQR